SFMTRRPVRRGATIFAKGDPGTGLMAVASGAVKLGVVAADGREAVFNIVRPGEIFGEIALLDGRPRTADATAISDCDLLVMDRRDFVSCVHRRPDFALKFIEILCERLRRTSEQVEDVMYLDLPGRLAKALLRFAGHDGAPVRRIALTQSELGHMIGMSRESTNKQLHAWARRNWVRLERRSVVVLDPDALARIAAGVSDEC